MRHYSGAPADENGGAVIRSPERRRPESNGSSSPATPQSLSPHEAEEAKIKLEGDEEEDGRKRIKVVVVKEEEIEGAEREDEEAEEDQERKILAIRDYLEDFEQPEDSLIQLLQNLEDMDITFKALKETDIGKYVSGLKKHPSSEVRRLSKQLIKKWKEMVDEWARKIKAVSPSMNSEDDSYKKNGHHEVPDSAYSSSLHNRSSMSPERRSDSKVFRRRDTPPPRPFTATTPSSTPPARAAKGHDDRLTDPEKLEAAKKRLHINYQKWLAEKKQRTIQVMEITDIPRGKNTFIARDKGGVKNEHR